MTQITLIFTDFFINFCNLGGKDKIRENQRYLRYPRNSG